MTRNAPGIRSFVAVDLPHEIKDKIPEVQRAIQAPGIRLVRPELVHITLKFLGDVPPDQIGNVDKALRSVKAQPFRAQVEGVGAFPGRSIRVIWLGISGDFTHLHRQVEEALQPLGFQRERKFVPHATLARVGRPTQETSALIGARLTELGKVEMGAFQVDRFLLKKSTLTPGGPIYEDIAEFSL
jgi:2'-5' RNA ligase